MLEIASRHQNTIQALFIHIFPLLTTISAKLCMIVVLIYIYTRLSQLTAQVFQNDRVNDQVMTRFHSD